MFFIIGHLNFHLHIRTAEKLKTVLKKYRMRYFKIFYYLCNLKIKREYNNRKRYNYEYIRYQRCKTRKPAGC